MHSRVMAVLAAALVFASTSLLLPDAEAQLTPTGTLAGRICYQPDQYGPYPMPYYAEGGFVCDWRGVPDATVTLHQTGAVPGVTDINRTTTTDADGFFAFGDLADGTYTLRAARTGFEAGEKKVEVEDGEGMVSLILKAKTVDQSARVVSDETGEPIAQAIISLCCPDGQEKRAESDTDGRFTMRMSAGHNHLSIRAPNHQETWTEIFSDGVAEPEIRVAPIPPPDATLRGTILDQDGAPVVGAEVSAYSWGGYFDHRPYREPAYHGTVYATTDAAGRFTLGVYEGQANLNAYKDGYAHLSRDLQIERGEDQDLSLTMKKFPAKTARIVGQVVDAETGKGIPYAYLNVRAPEYGQNECSERRSGHSGGDDMAASSIAPYPSAGCRITMKADGSFDGTVTPGYSIIGVWIDHYASCQETNHAGGSSQRICGKEYNSFTQTMVLPADATTTLTLKLQPRPTPDAIVSGYIVDGETGTAIPGAHINFNNQDSWGWGDAGTDGDGSYKISLRGGYHTVHVYAEGYLSWEGVLEIKPKSNTPFDVVLTPGFESYGYCCSHYDIAYAESSKGPSMPMATTPGPAPSPANYGVEGDGSGESAGAAYVDLDGGLGPYDPEERKKVTANQAQQQNTPALGLILVVGLLALVVAFRRH